MLSDGCWIIIFCLIGWVGCIVFIFLLVKFVKIFFSYNIIDVMVVVSMFFFFRVNIRVIYFIEIGIIFINFVDVWSFFKDIWGCVVCFYLVGKVFFREFVI